MSPVTRAVSHGGTGFRARGGYALAVQHAGAHSSVGRVARRWALRATGGRHWVARPAAEPQRPKAYYGYGARYSRWTVRWPF